MFKKTLISLAVASSLGLTGCFDDADSGANANPEPKIDNPAFTGKTWPVFNPVTGDIPIPNDLNFDQTAKDGSFAVAGDQTNPVIGALNNLSGASTVAPIVVRFSDDIDPDSVDSRAFILTDPNDPTSVIPNPRQNVFLIELAYASGEPVRGLSLQEPPTIPIAITAQVAAGKDPLDTIPRLGIAVDLQGRNQAKAFGYLNNLVANPEFDHDIIQLEGDSALRIRPNKPLNPLSRYVVVVTNEVRDASGDRIVGSPAYQNLRDPDTRLASPSLAPVRTLITRLWETIGSQYFGLNNQARADVGLPDLTKDNIALSLAITTSEDKKVLSHIANPANWFADQLRRSVTTAAAGAAVKGGASEFGQVFAAVEGAKGSFTPSAALDEFPAACDNDADPATTGFQTNLGAGVVTFEDKFGCVGTVVASSFPEGTFPKPSAQEFDILRTDNALAVSAVLSQLNFNGVAVDVHQGSIELPYFIAAPDATQTGPSSSIRTVSWRPNSGLAEFLGGELGVTIPQADPEVSRVLNYNFPFPTVQETVEVPMLIITQGGADPRVSGQDLIPVIYQHGITTDRSAALTFGSQLVASAAGAGLNVAVFAIDQPLHGVAPATTEERLELAGTLLAGVEDLVDLPEGTFNTEALREATVEGEIETLVGAGIPQANAFVIVGTVARAGSTIPGLAPANTATGFQPGEINERHFGFTAGPGNNPVPMNFETGFGSSGSLFINLSNFLNNRDILRQGAYDLMNLTATISTSKKLPGIDASKGVTFIGHSLGTINGGAFVGASKASGNSDLRVAGNHLLTPVAGITRLLENSPSFAPTILGGLQAAAGLTQGDADLETFLNVNQAALDSVDPINFADELKESNTLLSQINGDRTTPNAADSRFGEPPLEITLPNGVQIDSPAAPLTGSEALAAIMGATEGQFPVVDGQFQGGNTPFLTRYVEGVHTTPVLPLAEIAEPGDVLKDRTIAQTEQVVVTADDAKDTFSNMILETIFLLPTP
ncbi:hypothetical protein [Marinobacter sp.]|uniref:hypothetical protein n=1 Tax=Marinobacter sp. TaxID=50741 RepID=UPI00384CD7F3